MLQKMQPHRLNRFSLLQTKTVLRKALQIFVMSQGGPSPWGPGKRPGPRPGSRPGEAFGPLGAGPAPFGHEPCSVNSRAMSHLIAMDTHGHSWTLVSL